MPPILLNILLYPLFQESQTKKATSLIGSLDVVALDLANSSQTNAAEMENVGKCSVNQTPSCS